MNCYKLVPDVEDHRTITGQPNPGRKQLSPYPLEIWSTIRDLEFSHDGRFTAASKAEISKLNLIIRPNPGVDLPDIIGCFSELDNFPPAVSRKLRNAISNVSMEFCDFAELASIWDERAHKEHPGLGYSLATILPRLDSWDWEASKVWQPMPDDNPSYYAVGGTPTVKAAAIDGAILWRDAFTKTPLCTGTFKDIAESSGCSGLKFEPVAISEK